MGDDKSINPYSQSSGSQAKETLSYIKSEFKGVETGTYSFVFHVERSDGKKGNIKKDGMAVLALVKSSLESGHIPQGSYLTRQNLNTVVRALEQHKLLDAAATTLIAQARKAKDKTKDGSDRKRGTEVAAAEPSPEIAEISSYFQGSIKEINASDAAVAYLKSKIAPYTSKTSANDEDVSLKKALRSLTPVINAVLDRNDIQDTEVIKRGSSIEANSDIQGKMKSLGQSIAEDLSKPEFSAAESLERWNKSYSKDHEDLLYGFTVQAFKRIKEKEASGYARQAAIDLAYASFLQKLRVLNYMARHGAK